MQSLEQIVPEGTEKERLDVYISRDLRIFSRASLKKRLLEAYVNGKSVKLSRIISAGDVIRLDLSDPPVTTALPEDIPLDIIYEDENCVVVNKKSGMVTHPGAGNFSGTLLNALLGRRRGASVYITHRLDKDTSGVIIASYNEETQNFLQAQFKNRTTRKTYAAIVAGNPPHKKGVIDTFITRDKKNRILFTTSVAHGKRAITHYRVVKRWQAGGGVYCLLKLRPKTGRTHQLRVHLASVGCPIVGDPLYGKKDAFYKDARLMLHAYSLEIALLHAETPRKFRAKLPARFRQAINAINHFA